MSPPLPDLRPRERDSEGRDRRASRGGIRRVAVCDCRVSFGDPDNASIILH
jgi:hypothetical protein